MIFPSGDAIERNVSSRYSLVVLAAKRAKQIKEGAPVLIDTESTNPLTIALEEIAAGKVTILEGSYVVPTQGGSGPGGELLDAVPPSLTADDNLDEAYEGDEDADMDDDDADAPAMADEAV